MTNKAVGEWFINPNQNLIPKLWPLQILLKPLIVQAQKIFENCSTRSFRKCLSSMRITSAPGYPPMYSSTAQVPLSEVTCPVSFGASKPDRSPPRTGVEHYLEKNWCTVRIWSRLSNVGTFGSRKSISLPLIQFIWHSGVVAKICESVEPQRFVNLE